jgi:hypothetical protein
MNGTRFYVRFLATNYIINYPQYRNLLLNFINNVV